ncbi:MAG: hypothetical protein PVI97_08825 [Candidatus Thiodiazotropha sp.]|jgi:uncharacterized membrane protein YgcG
MTFLKRITFSTAALATAILVCGETALAACNATVNGRPMTQQECAVSIQVYGYVIPGDYLVDDYGNWVNVNNPKHRGNTYRDAQSSHGGSWGSRSYVGSSTVYDASGGCEGGGCVNIID